MMYLGADHGGFQLKEQIKEWMTQQAISFEDMGASAFDPTDDYPQYAAAVAQRVSESPDHKGVLICTSGGGMVIAANRFPKVRAIEAFDIRTAQHARSNNNANVLVLSGGWLSFEQAIELIGVWLRTPFSNEERHARRLSQIESFQISQTK